MVGITGIAPSCLRPSCSGKTEFCWLDEGITAYKIDDLSDSEAFCLHRIGQRSAAILPLRASAGCVVGFILVLLLRLPSAIFGVVTIRLLFLQLGGLYLTVEWPFLSCWLLCLSTFHVWFRLKAKIIDCLYCLCFRTFALLLHWCRWNAGISKS